MRYITGIIVAVVIYMSIAWFSRTKPVPQVATTDQLMALRANEMVKMWQKEKNIELDYSMESIGMIEQELTRLSKIPDTSSNQVVTLDAAILHGAYVGEVLRRHEGGTWAVDDPIGGPRSFPMMATNRLVYFPVAWSWILLNGGEANIQNLTNLPPASIANPPPHSVAKPPAGSQAPE
jgi:hypothetical protein